MEDESFFIKKLTQRISRETMEEYEAVRASGLTNMFDYFNVIEICRKLEFKNLGGISLNGYKELLGNFSRLMKYYDIKQDRKPAISVKFKKEEKEK